MTRSGLTATVRFARGERRRTSLALARGGRRRTSLALARGGRRRTSLALARGVRPAALLALALGAAGCAREAPGPAAWPPGALLVGRSSALASLAERLARIEGTPVAREAAAWSAALPACELVEVRAPQASLAALRAGLRCADPSGPLAPVHRDRGEHALVFAWPAGDERVTGHLDLLPDGDLDLRLEVPGGAFAGPRALLRPGAVEPGPAVLGGGEALLHARLRPEGGIDLPALLAQDSQADQLFSLRSRLFSAAILDGTWELALYLPGEKERLPRAALALGTRHPETARAAADRFLDEIETHWPLRRTPFALGDAQGACLRELRLLPGLAPCYVATGRALVVGWTEASLRKALDGSAPELPASGGLVADLARLPAADARIAAPARPAGAPSWPWRRLVAEPRRAGAAVGLRLTLAGGSDA